MNEGYVLCVGVVIEDRECFPCDAMCVQFLELRLFTADCFAGLFVTERFPLLGGDVESENTFDQGSGHRCQCQPNGPADGFTESFHQTVQGECMQPAIHSYSP